MDERSARDRRARRNVGATRRRRPGRRRARQRRRSRVERSPIRSSSTNAASSFADASVASRSTVSSSRCRRHSSIESSATRCASSFRRPTPRATSRRLTTVVYGPRACHDLYLSGVPVYLLPLFPLPLVLFPGAPLPLHIFEPRYRQLLSDCMDGRLAVRDRLPARGARRDATSSSGRVGCVAEVDDAHTLPDGTIEHRRARRSAVLAATIRDEPGAISRRRSCRVRGPPGGRGCARAGRQRVRELFTRVGRAARTLADDHDPLPTLPDDPDALSFGIAALIDMELPRRQELLASRLASERLETHRARCLSSAVESLEARARVHGRAKSNGRGPYVSK